MKKSVATSKKKEKFQAFRMLAIAPSNYGKSYMICQYALNLVKSKIIHSSRILIFSKTWRSDNSQLELITYCAEQYPQFLIDNCHESIQYDLLDELFQTQKLIKDEGITKLHHWLAIFDDQISDATLTAKHNKLTNLYCLGRHYNISTIMSLQSYRSSISSVCRNQMTIIAIGRLSSVQEQEDILSQYDQSCGSTKRESLKKITEYYTAAIQQMDNHGFLVINCTKQYGQGRLQQGISGDVYYDKQ